MPLVPMFITSALLCSTMAKAIAAEGAKVAILDLDKKKSQIIADEINNNNGTAIAIECDG